MREEEEFWGGGGGGEGGVFEVVRGLVGGLGWVCLGEGFFSELENFRRRYVGCLSL